MNRSTLVGVSVSLVSCLWMAIPPAGAAQYIVGTVVDSKDSRTPLRGVEVAFLDAANAALVAVVLTDSDGRFTSGEIPAGSYKVRFSAGGSYNPEFFGATDVDEFCDEGAATVDLSTGTTVTISDDMRASDPSPVVSQGGSFEGTVFDGASRAPLHGIPVSIFRADNGQLLFKGEDTFVTDATGYYRSIVKTSASAVRIRFSDPTGAYFPEFAEASDLARDEFCAATSFRLGEDPVPHYVVDAFLDRIPPEHNTENLLETIEALNLPDNLTSLLETPLIRAVDLLTDANPNNDAAVCGQLTSFINRVDIQERNGQLTQAEAAALRQSAINVQTAMGCG